MQMKWNHGGSSEHRVSISETLRSMVLELESKLGHIVLVALCMFGVPYRLEAALVVYRPFGIGLMALRCEADSLSITVL